MITIRLYTSRLVFSSEMPQEGRYTWTRHGMTVLVKAPIGVEVNKREIQATFAQRKAG